MSNTVQNAKITAQEMLEQIMSAGKELAAEGKVKTAGVTKKSKELAAKGEDFLVDKLGIEDTEVGRAALRKGAAVGAGAGALALLLGSRSGRKLAVMGGLAGLGTLAYKAYQKNGGKMPKSMNEAVGLLKGPKADARAQALIAAMVAAAKADGEISNAELALIKAHNSTDAEALKTALSAEPDAKAIAAMADSDQGAREIYAVSCRVASGLSPSERDYLDALAMALRLDPELAARIETDVRTGS